MMNVKNSVTHTPVISYTMAQLANGRVFLFEDSEYERGDLVCFGEARQRVVCESGGGEGRGPGTILPGHCHCRFTTLFVLRMGWD